MLMIKFALLGAVALSVVSASLASAADLPPRPAPPPIAKAPVIVEPVWIWTGFYLGAHGGWAGGDAKYTFLTNDRYNTAAGETASQSISGGMAGGHIGFNWQFGNFV